MSSRKLTPSDLLVNNWIIDLDEGMGNRTFEFLAWCNEFLIVNEQAVKKYNDKIKKKIG